MAHINEDMLKLPGGYLFTEIARKVGAFKESPSVVKAMHSAVDEMSRGTTFRGYGPERGYEFLRHAIAENDFRARGIKIDEDEIFVNDGAKSDTGNFQELLGKDVKIGVSDPIYPVYVDSNAMGGRTGILGADGRWSDVVYMPCTEENDFVPELPSEHVDVIYLCYPNNPTGTTLTRSELKRWVEYAAKHDALIFYDSAYEAYRATTCRTASTRLKAQEKWLWSSAASRRRPDSPA